jgi:hypothetical protein
MPIEFVRNTRKIRTSRVPGGSHNEEGFFALKDVMDVTSADRTSDRQLFDKGSVALTGVS